MSYSKQSRSWRRVRTRALVIFFGFAGLLGVSVFLASEPLGDAAERYLVRIASPFIADLNYHGEPVSFAQQQFFSTRQTDRHHRIVSVVVDDDTLNRESASFPLQYWQYAAHLELVGLQKPKAIFMDVWLHDERLNDFSMEELVRVICDLQNPPADAGREPVHMFLLSMRAHGKQLHPELQKYSNQSNESGLAPCFTEVGAEVPQKEPEQRGWFYPFQSCPAAGCKVDTADACPQCIPSAAVAIYNQALIDDASQRVNASQPGNFQVIWGNRAPEQSTLNDFYRAIYDGHVELNTACVERKSAFYFLHHFLFSEWVGDPPVCNPFAEFTTHEVAQARLGIHKTGAGAFMREQLDDSIVLYGYKLAGLNDFVQSPIHGMTSGLNFHGMALHNLDRLGPGVIAESQYQSVRTDYATPEFLYMLGLCLSGSAYFAFRRRFKALLRLKVLRPIRRTASRAASYKAGRVLHGFRIVSAKWQAMPLSTVIEKLFVVLYGFVVFVMLVIGFTALNAYLRLDYTLLIEGVFFVFALASTGYLRVFVRSCMNVVNRLGRFIKETDKNEAS